MSRISQTVATSAAILAVLVVSGLMTTAPAVASVPSPGPGEAVVTVRIGGDRVDDATVAGLPGATLGLYADQGDATPLQTCVSDADGDCSFVVSGALLGTSPWVGQVAAPGGWFANDSLRTGPGSGSGSIDTPYRFQTPVLAAGGTYRSTSDFMFSTSNSSNTRSNGIWQQSRANPPLPAQCGMDVALVLDLSASVGSNLPNLKSAADSFADAFVGTPSRMAAYSFSAQSPSVESSTGAVDENQPALRSVSTQAGADAFKAVYAGWGLGAGTNWDAALQRVADSGVHYDAVIVLTDGNPTRWGGGTLRGDGANTHFTDVEAAVFSANTIKAQGTRVVSFGVGSGVSGITSRNLAAISGPVPFDPATDNVGTADYFQIPDFSGAGDELRRLALANCSGALTVVKQIVPSTTTGDDVTGAVPAGAGWRFDATATTPQATVDPGAATTTDDGTGTVAFEVGYPPAAANAQVSVTEVQQAGYTLVPQGGGNAVCTNLTTGDPLAVGPGGVLGFTVEVPVDQAVSCTVYNRAPAPAATVQVDKSWIVDGTTYANGSQPAGIVAALGVSPPVGGTPQTQPFGAVLTGYQVGGAVTLTETTSLGATGCSLLSSRVTEADGATIDTAVPYSTTLGAAASHFTIVNVVTCPTIPVVTPPPAEPAGALADTGSDRGSGGSMILATGAALALITGIATTLGRPRRRRRRV